MITYHPDSSNKERCEICRGTGNAPNYTSLKYQFFVDKGRTCIACNGRGGVPTHCLALDAWVQCNRRSVGAGAARFGSTSWFRKYWNHFDQQMVPVRVYP